jgi:TolB-like protein/Flp pilus assembly protein TadD
LIGRTLGHYTIVSAIGAGGMGEVYRAHDRRLKRDVALKVLPPEMASSPERLERFRREAQALAALDHPGIVTVYSVEEFDGVHFLTMQLVEGQSLDRVVPAGGLTPSQVLEIGTALAEALAAAHEKGIVHRDLKPANVMLTGDGRVKVLDFGLAKVLSGAQGVPAASDATFTSAGQTAVGVVMGTPAYMSPEQVAGRAVDHRSDVFSFGALLYEMATGRRPFEGASSAELASAILRDAPPALEPSRSDLPEGLRRVISRCLEKKPEDRFTTVRDAAEVLRALRSGPSSIASMVPTPSVPAAPAPSTGSRRKEEGFWVAVLPFTHRGSDAGVEALAEGLTEEVVTGLSRFSYLRVIARGSTARYASGGADVRAIGNEIGARYVMEGSLRQAGPQLRVAVQLVDATTGAHLWAETYNRPFDPNAVFALQDDLVPRIVSTVADMNGVLPHTMSEALRARDPRQLSPYEAVVRGLGYYARITVEEHAAVRDALEGAVQEAPGNADAWALLAEAYAEEHKHGFNVRPDPLGRALDAARRAVAAAPSNHLAQHGLAQALFFRRELQAFRPVADRAVALNPADGSTIAFMGILMAYAGDWDHGLALAERAMSLNPHHPGWYRLGSFFGAYRKKDYRAALDIALKVNMPSYYYTHASTAAAYGQLGEREAAQAALRELLALKPDFASVAREDYGKWFVSGELVEHILDGLRKAGLEVPPPAGAGRPEGAGSDARPTATTSSSSLPRDAASVAIAVLPFSDMSPAKDQDDLCEGMAEEIMHALVGVEGIRVASRTSAFRARQEGHGLPEIARLLSVGHVLDGSVRAAGARLRVTARLTDTATGYQLWSERFDRDAADVFAIQDEIAAGVVNAVKARLAPGAAAVQTRPQAPNLEAYRWYLRGRHLRYAKEDHAAAIQAFREAIRIDPTHAPSWTGLAESLPLAAHFNAIAPREACAAAREALAKAVALEGESADSFHGEAFVALIERRWPAMEAAWRRAIEIQPTHVQALASFGITLCCRQKADEGLRLLQRAREADPLASFPCMLTAMALTCIGQRREALRYAEDALAFEEEDVVALMHSSMARIALGDHEQGIADAEHVVALTGRGAVFLGTLGWALATAGRRDEARRVLDEIRTWPGGAPVPESWVLGALGDADAAFEAIARAEDGLHPLLYYTGLPAYDPLRGDARFAAFMRRLELQPD